MMANQKTDNKKEKLWGIRVPLSKDFDKELWQSVIEDAANAGMNAIMLWTGNGIRYESHPEIAREDAVSPEWIREQVRICREKGIALYPELNLSASHDEWLGEYARMLSTSIYYKVIKDFFRDTFLLDFILEWC